MRLFVFFLHFIQIILLYELHSRYVRHELETLPALMARGLHRQSSCRWFKMLWRSCDFTVIKWRHLLRPRMFGFLSIFASFVCLAACWGSYFRCYTRYNWWLVGLSPVGPQTMIIYSQLNPREHTLCYVFTYVLINVIKSRAHCFNSKAAHLRVPYLFAIDVLQIPLYVKG